jgi:hypothetical protein
LELEQQKRLTREKNVEVTKLKQELQNTTSALTCPICLTQKIECVSSCGHCFCRECTDGWKKTWVNANRGVRDVSHLKCPLCRETLAKNREEFKKLKFNKVFIM